MRAMTTEFARQTFTGLLLAAVLFPAPRARAATQAARFAPESIALGTGGYTLNFDVAWSCDAAASGLPPSGVLLSDDSAATKRTDRETRTTSFRSGPAH
jgi:hypothetical protein